MMRFMIVLLFAPFTVAAQQSLHLEVRDLGKPTQTDSGLVYKFIDKSSNIVYLTSKATDSALFDLINQYRTSHNVKALPHSERLDTLAHIVLLKNTTLPELTHYSKIPELSEYVDLLNAENLLRHTQYDLKVGARNLKNILKSWDQSLRHQKNLLETVGESDVGAVHVILKVSYYDNDYHFKLYAIYEIDNKLSKREYNQKLDDVNKFLLSRPIKFKKT